VEKKKRKGGRPAGLPPLDPKVFRRDAIRKIVKDEFGYHYNFCKRKRHELKGRNCKLQKQKDGTYRVICRRCYNDRVIARNRERAIEAQSKAQERFIEAYKDITNHEQPPRAVDLARIAELERRLLELGGELPESKDYYHGGPTDDETPGRDQGDA
jgi:hypothetical protein